VREQSRPDQLIDAALDLCIRCGYETTTLEQIAAAAEITPQKFMRHFATKDAALMAAIEVVLHAVATALRDVDADASPEQALLVAHTEVLVAITEGRGCITRDRMLAIGELFTANASLRKQASVSRKRILTVALAERMGVAAENRRVRKAVTMWSAVAASAYLDRNRMADNYDPSQDDHLKERVVHELGTTFTEVLGSAPDNSRDG
jgi:AcrR family transcriptional regulator